MKKLGGWHRLWIIFSITVFLISLCIFLSEILDSGYDETKTVKITIANTDYSFKVPKNMSNEEIGDLMDQNIDSDLTKCIKRKLLIDEAVSRGFQTNDWKVNNQLLSQNFEILKDEVNIKNDMLFNCGLALPSYNQLATALRGADKAQDIEAAKVLATAIKYNQYDQNLSYKPSESSTPLANKKLIENVAAIRAAASKLLVTAKNERNKDLQLKFFGCFGSWLAIIFIVYFIGWSINWIYVGFKKGKV